MSAEHRDNSLTSVVIALDEEEVAAVEGWRQANLFTSQSDAVRALLRLGLVSEIARTYRSLTLPRNGTANAGHEGTCDGD